MLGPANFLSLQTFSARQNRFFRTNCMPLARKRSQHPRELTQSPAGTTHISPPWQRWENVHQLQEAPERGDTSISRIAAPQSAKRPEFSTYENRVCNSCRICTSIFIGLKSVWNQHLQKYFRGAHIIDQVGRCHSERSVATSFLRKSCLRDFCRDAKAKNPSYRAGARRGFFLRWIHRRICNCFRIRTYAKKGEGG